MIRNTINKCFELEQPINYDELIFQICEEFRTTRRTAIEYVKTALIEVEYEIKKVNNINQLYKLGNKPEQSKLIFENDGLQY